MKPCPHSLDSVLPHKHPMILIDEIVGYDAACIKSAVTVRANAQFFRPGRGIPAHVGLEWMAQTCGAFAGAHALDNGGGIRTGLLLGTRDFVSAIRWYREGQRVEVHAKQLFDDGQIGSFECSITQEDAGKPLATACLTVYQLDAGGALPGAGGALPGAGNPVTLK